MRYKKGQRVPQDCKEAVKLFTLAAEQGYAPAQTNLGLFYAQGKGVLADFVMAHMWFNIAAANGIENGAENREIVAKGMTWADISKAQAMARV